MAKDIEALVKLQIPGGGATPAPPVGSALGQYGVNVKLFLFRLRFMLTNHLHILQKQLQHLI